MYTADMTSATVQPTRAYEASTVFCELPSFFGRAQLERNGALAEVSAGNILNGQQWAFFACFRERRSLVSHSKPDIPFHVAR